MNFYKILSFFHIKISNYRNLFFFTTNFFENLLLERHFFLISKIKSIRHGKPHTVWYSSHPAPSSTSSLLSILSFDFYISSYFSIIQFIMFHRAPFVSFISLPRLTCSFFCNNPTLQHCIHRSRVSRTNPWFIYLCLNFEIFKNSPSRSCVTSKNLFFHLSSILLILSCSFSSLLVFIHFFSHCCASGF